MLSTERSVAVVGLDVVSLGFRAATEGKGHCRMHGHSSLKSTGTCLVNIHSHNLHDSAFHRRLTPAATNKPKRNYSLSYRTYSPN